MIVLVESVHVQLPAEAGVHLFRAQVVVVIETKTRHSLVYTAHHFINIKAFFRIGHDEYHAVFLFHLQRLQAQGGAVDGVKALLTKGHAHQFTFQIVGPAVIGAGK